MFNSKEEYNIKSAERLRPSPFGNDSSGSKSRSNFKMLNPKSKNYEEDDKLQQNEFSAKNNLMNNFQNHQKSYSIFNISEMSPTINNYYPHILQSNMNENKEKFCETPIKYNNVNNEIDWYPFPNNQERENGLSRSPLFPNFKSNKNLEISSSIKRTHYCYNPNITKKNLGFEIENINQHNNILNSMNNNFINECSNIHLHNYNNHTNNYIQCYQPKKLFVNHENQYGGPTRVQQDKVIPERKIIMSSDDEEISIATKNTFNNKNIEIDTKSGFANYSPKGNKIKDNCILNSDNSNQIDDIANIRESSRKKLKRANNSKLKQPLKFDKKSKNMILTHNKQGNSHENLTRDKKTKFIGDSKQLLSENVQKTKCTCSKTQCVKKYCECFSNGKFCVDCECENCQNLPNNLEYLNDIRAKENLIFGKDKQDVLRKTSKVVCNCTKSGCRKKYCECFKAGKKCSEECRCIHCDNIDECKISADIRKNKKLYTEKRNNSKSRQRYQHVVNGPSEYSSDDCAKPILYKAFDTESFKLYNINVLINRGIMSISEKNVDLNIECMKNKLIFNSNHKISNSKSKNLNKRVNKKRLVNKIKKKNPTNRENIKNSKNKLDFRPHNRLNILRSNKISNFIAQKEEEIKLCSELNLIHFNEANINLIHVPGDEEQKISFRRSARLRLNKNDLDILNNKLYYHPDSEGLNWENDQEKKNIIKNNEFNLIGLNKKVHKLSQKNIKDNSNQSLDFYSSVLNKESLEKVLFKKDSIKNNASDCTNSSNEIEKDTEGQNDIHLSSNKKGSNSKLGMFESASKINDQNRKEQLLKITETPKLCDKKRYRNTTSAKTRVFNEDIYNRTNSTMNQTPVMKNNKNNKKKLIEVDKRIVKNLQSKYY